MLLLQITAICDVCGKSVTHTRQAEVYEDPVLDFPADWGYVGGDYIRKESDDYKELCPECRVKLQGKRFNE